MLNITVDINGVVVEALHAQRISPIMRLDSAKKKDLATLCQYTITSRDGHWLGHTPLHRYGDGAAQLAAKVLKRFGRKKMR